MKIAVVGAGLIGSAAARHLAAAGHEVAVIGPGEPVDWTAHVGAFASHYDEGRITRVGDRKPFFARASAASIGRYGEIEAASGISFFTECGALIAGGPDYMAQVHAVRETVAAAHDRLEGPELATRFPFLAFPEGTSGDHEPTGAGHISPRRLVAAQLKVAASLGARHLAEEAAEVAPGRVRTKGEVVEADEVIVAAGGWTDSLLGREAEHRVYARTVAFHEIPPDEQARLAAMPSILLERPDIYVLPPIRYPDGRVWLKLGGDPEDRLALGRDQINAWFRSGGDATVGDHLTEVLCVLIPGLRFTDRRIAPCVTTFTGDGLPEIRRIAPGLTVAAAGNGAGAKCSDELGRLAAAVATGQEEDGE